jgi:hypothetical protein
LKIKILIMANVNPYSATEMSFDRPLHEYPDPLLHVFYHIEAASNCLFTIKNSWREIAKDIVGHLESQIRLIDQWPQGKDATKILWPLATSIAGDVQELNNWDPQYEDKNITLGQKMRVNREPKGKSAAVLSKAVNFDKKLAQVLVEYRNDMDSLPSVDQCGAAACCFEQWLAEVKPLRV